MQFTSFATKLSALLALYAHSCLARPQMAPAPASAAAGGMQQAQFEQNVTIPGGMTRLISQFPDGTTVNIMSPEQRVLTVTQNKQPLPGNFVSGSSGGPWMSLTNTSLLMATQDIAVDMIVSVSMKFDSAVTTSMGVDPSNVFIGMLASGGRGAGSWDVVDAQQSVDPKTNTVTMNLMNSVDGEFILLARMTPTTKNALQTYGGDAVQFTGETDSFFGDQEVVYEDGLRISAQSVSPFTVKAEIVPAVQQVAMPAQAKILNSFAWKITMSTPEKQINNGQIDFPFNPNQAFNVMPSLHPSANLTNNLSIARRRTNSTNVASGSGATFVPIGTEFQAISMSATTNMISVQGFADMNGEYIVLLSQESLQSQGIIG